MKIRYKFQNGFIVNDLSRAIVSAQYLKSQSDIRAVIFVKRFVYILATPLGICNEPTISLWRLLKTIFPKS
jgi:hypothetical protein